MPVDFSKLLNKRRQEDRVAEEPDFDATAPNVLADELTFEEKTHIARAENELTRQAQSRREKHEFVFPDGFSIKTEFALNNGQQAALSSLAEWSQNPNLPLYNLQGYAGTGKTTIMRLFVQYLVRDWKRAIVLAAPTHRAKQVLYKLAGGVIAREDCLTLHSLLSLRPTFDMDDLDLKNLPFAQEGESKMPHGGIVIVDECSMIGDKLLDVLIELATEASIKLLFVGDPAQLKPVKQNTLSRCFSIKYVSQLREVMRQKDGNPISYLLEDIRNNQLATTDVYQRYDRLSALEEGILFTQSATFCRNWVNQHLLSDAFKEDPNYVRVLAGTNQRVSEFNQSMRRVLYGEGAPEYVQGELITGYANYGSDDNYNNLITNSADYLIVEAVETTRNLIGLDVPGWYLTFVEADSTVPKHRRAKKRVFVVSRQCDHDTLAKLGEHLNELQKQAIADRKAGKHKPWSRFHAFKESFCTCTEYKKGRWTLIKKTLDYGYAMTVHKSQGGTYDYVLVDEANIDATFYEDHQLRNQLKYVALSRASKQVLCLTNKPIITPSYDF